MLRKQLFKTPEETRKTTEKENTDDLEVQDEYSPLRRTLGIICAMSSCIFFAFSSLLVKLLREIPPQEVVFFRNMVQVIFVLPPLIYNKIPIVGNTKHLPFLCVRGIAGTLALCCQFYAFQHMALADATVIVFSAPIFTGVLAHFLLGEAWGWFDAVATLLCFTGVVLIARPTFLFPRPIESTTLASDWEQVIKTIILVHISVICWPFYFHIEINQKKCSKFHFSAKYCMVTDWGNGFMITVTNIETLSDH